MIVKALVTSEMTNSYEGKKGHVDQVIASCLDMDEAVSSRMVNTFDHVLTPDEQKAHAGKLVGKTVLVSVKGFEVFNGRMRTIRGSALVNGLK